MMRLKKLIGKTVCGALLLLLLLTNMSCKHIPKEGGRPITYNDASKLIDGFQSVPEKSRYPLSSIVNINTIKSLLGGAPNLRIYFGEDSITRLVNLVLVAADNNSEDLKNGKCILITKRGVEPVTMAAAASYTYQFQQHAKRQYPDFPYAEKFNASVINSTLLKVPGIINLRIDLGKDANGTFGVKGAVRIVLYAASADSRIITNNPAAVGQTKSANPTYRMASYMFSDPQAVEDGQRCLDQCTIGSSQLYHP